MVTGRGLAVRDLGVHVDGEMLLEAITFDVAPGEIMALLGPSGCGKTTLLRSITGLQALSSGSVVIGGRDVTRVPTHKRGLALLFQEGQLFANRTVAANIAFPLRIRRLGKAQIAREVTRLLDLVGLQGFGDRSVTEMSGGERQRVALARALAVDPAAVLLDEPLSALDRQLRDRLAVDLREILKAADVSAVFVTHDHEEAFAIADTMALLRAGRIVQRGSLSEVWSRPRDAEAAAFLGYPMVLDAGQAALLGVESGLAMRRSALHVDPAGAITALVRSVRPTPDRVRLVVDVSGVGELNAVADRGFAADPGALVRLALDLDRCALLERDHNPQTG
jgi:thiamine transport system ATP-binding protein